MNTIVLNAVEKFIARHDMLSGFDHDSMVEVFGDYAANFPDPESALEQLSLQDQVVLLERVGRRMMLARTILEEAK